MNIVDSALQTIKMKDMRIGQICFFKDEYIMKCSDVWVSLDNPSWVLHSEAGFKDDEIGYLLRVGDKLLFEVGEPDKD